MTRRGGYGRHNDGHSPSRYSREGDAFDTVFSILASLLASKVGGLTEGSRANHARPMASGSSRPRTGPVAWPVAASLEATVAHRTGGVVDNATVLMVDRAHETLDVPTPSATPVIDAPQ